MVGFNNKKTINNTKQHTQHIKQTNKFVQPVPRGGGGGVRNHIYVHAV